DTRPLPVEEVPTSSPVSDYRRLRVLAAPGGRSSGAWLGMRNYISRLHLVLVATLLLLTVAFGLVGLSISPASGGFSAVPSGLMLALTKGPISSGFIVTMSPSSHGGSVLA